MFILLKLTNHIEYKGYASYRTKTRSAQMKFAYIQTKIEDKSCEDISSIQLLLEVANKILAQIPLLLPTSRFNTCALKNE